MKFFLPKTSQGAGLIEFGILVGLISILAISAVYNTGSEVKRIFSTTGNTLSENIAFAAGDNVALAPGDGGEVNPGPPLPACGTGLTIGSNTYPVVQIGDQCWMSQNLNEAFGTSVCFGGQQSNCDADGRLYAHSGANANYINDNLCQDGWHLPTDDDWKVLETFLGMDPSELDQIGYRTSGDVEEQLSDFASDGTNSTGFNMQPAGLRYNSSYLRIDIQGVLMTAGSNRWRSIRSTDEGFVRGNSSTPNQYYTSARCMKDL